MDVNRVFYRFYHGEVSNPFSKNTLSYKYWQFEKDFDLDFNSLYTYDWYGRFNDVNVKIRFMSMLCDDEFHKPTQRIKSTLFNFWLSELPKSDVELYYYTVCGL